MKSALHVLPIAKNQEASFITGTIESQLEGRYTLITSLGTLDAELSFGCAFIPQVNDKVCLCLDENNHAYILHILHRQQSSEKVLHAEDNLVISSAKDIQLQCRDYHVRSNRIISVCRDSIQTAQNILTKTTSIKTIFDSWEVLGRSLLQRLKSSHKQVEGLDQTKAEQVHLEAKSNLRTRSKQTSIRAKKDVRIDGERVHMG